ncbi:hypothetical protein M1M98_02135 [Thermodesulfovibrionales bacterium]|nr:hypothetical protein [Thermodesulfovibrionales bacterium]MCL0033558.1 hypothetical protein [Thermodesulfovibrionales bacterium]MCL0034005.1 hypothetical protein [Thermodesulfovibrionales bacterium]MCL0042415.1 hypothetical protein [Thermodesulfovibrionales bacterium]MCL0047053.1 hypothetical protein [Thermodesulfovibrionales bacterium]
MATIAPIFGNQMYVGAAEGQGGVRAQNTLGKDAFLKLLMAQLRNQDPLEPIGNTEFIAQLANFSTLEQITNMSTNMEGFLRHQHQHTALVAANTIGKEIETIGGHKGTVSGVSIEAGGVYLIVGDDKIAFGDIKEIRGIGN